MAETPTCKYKILVVDDDPEILASISLGLQETGQTLFKASVGLTALDLAEAEVPDIVVLDVMLPKRGGFQVLQKLKGHPTMKGKRPLVCMITGNEGMLHKQFAEQQGVDDFLRKPFAIGRLLDIVNGFIEKLDKGVENAKQAGAK